MLVRRTLKGGKVGLVIGITKDEIVRLHSEQFVEINISAYGLDVAAIMLVTGNTEAGILEAIGLQAAKPPADGPPPPRIILPH